MSYYQNKIAKWYSEAVRLNASADSTLKNALKAHERVPQLISNLDREFQKIQNNRLKQGKPYFQETTLKSLVYDYTDLFLKLIIKQKDEIYASEIEKVLAQRKRQEQLDLEATANGKPQGIFEEIDMTVVTDRESKENGAAKEKTRTTKV